MKEDEILDQLNLIFRDILDDEAIELDNQTTANDVEGWDSLSHIHLVVAIEKHFKVKFTSKEIQGWNNIGDLQTTIANKIA